MISPITGFVLVAFLSTQTGVPTGVTSLGNFASKETCEKAKEQLFALAKTGFTISADCIPGVIVAITTLPDVSKKKENETKIDKKRNSSDAPK